MAACLSSSASSQEYSPVIEDRVEAGLLQPPESGPEYGRHDGWDIGLVISAAYDDNVFLSAKKPESDMVFQVAPAIAYAKGDGNAGEGGFVKAGYVPTLVVYSANGDENRVDHRAVAVAAWRGKVTRMTYTGAIRRLGDATAETGRPTTRMEIENEIRGAWIPREKIALEIAAGNRQWNYSDETLNDSNTIYGEVALRYTYSPKTELGLAWRIGRLQVDRSDDQDTHQLTAEIAWQPREKIRVKIEAGAEHRSVGGRSEINPVLEGGVYWTPREGTQFYLMGTMREEASSYYSGQNYSVRGFTAGFSQRLNRVWSARLDGGYERDSYRRVSGSGAGDRSDNIWFIRPAVTCRVADESELSIFYRFSEDDSSEPGFGYDQQVLGVEFNHKF